MAFTLNRLAVHCSACMMHVHLSESHDHAHLVLHWFKNWIQTSSSSTPQL